MTVARPGALFVVAAPSGTGKTTVCRRLVDADPGLEFSVSHTTRPPREGEVEGVHYRFVSKDRFEALVARDAFLEWAEYNGHFYGTSWQAIDEPLGRGHDVLLEIEIQGAAQVRRRRSDARFIFLLPPSLEALEERLRGRGTDAPGVIERRLDWARRMELPAARDFDYVVVNADLDACLADLRTIVAAERRGAAAALRERFAPERALASLPDRAGGPARHQ
jgi:guanylate kinase